MRRANHTNNPTSPPVSLGSLGFHTSNGAGGVTTVNPALAGVPSISLQTSASAIRYRVSAKQFVLEQNWAQGIDAAGRPMRTANIPTPDGTRVRPGYAGATNWYSPSYNERTKLFYLMTLEDCHVYTARPEPFEEGKEYYSTGAAHPRGEHATKYLLAYDFNKGEFAWRNPQVGDSHSFAGVMSTVTGLVAFWGRRGKVRDRRCEIRCIAVALQRGTNAACLAIELRGER